MAARASWKGFLKLSLVSCAVSMFTATSTASRIRFNILNRETGNRIHNRVVDAETSEEVPTENRIKGYRVQGDQYVLVEDDELDEVALESTHTIDIDSFVPREEVDEIYLDESYYLAPGDKVGTEAFAVIREAMDRRKMVGLGKVVVHRRERLLMLQPRGKGILATALRYNTEVRDSAAYFDEIEDVKIEPEMLKLAEHILDSKKAHFDPTKFADRYEDALVELIKAKQAGRAPQPVPTRPASNVVNLMDALRRSVQAEGSSAPAAEKRKESPRRAGRAKTARPRAAGKRGRLKRAG